MDSKGLARVVQAVVSADELAYLLRMVGATSAFGIADGLWAIEPDRSLEQRFRDGFDSLVRNGWFEVTERADRPTQYTINPNLVLMAATLADPDVVVVTNRYRDDNLVETSTHYITDELLVEQIERADKQFRLMCLPAHSTMIERLATTLDIPNGPSLHADVGAQSASTAQAGLEKNAAPVSLSWTKISALDQIVQHRRGFDDLPKEVGIDEAEVEILESVFLNAKPVAKMEIGRTFGHRLLSMHTMMLFKVDDELWAVHSGDSQQELSLEKLDVSRFQQILHNSVDELARIQPERVY